MKNKKNRNPRHDELAKAILQMPLAIFKLLFSAIGSLYQNLISKLRFSITFRINIMYAFVILFALMVVNLCLLGGGFAWMFQNEGHVLNRDYLLTEAYLKNSSSIPEAQLKQQAQLYDISISLFDKDGKLVFTTEPPEKETTFLGKNTDGNIVIEQDSNRKLMLTAALPTTATTPSKGNVFGNYIYAMVLMDEFTSSTSNYQIQIVDFLPEEAFYAGIFVLVLLGMDIFFLMFIMMVGTRSSKKILSPIQTMTDTVKSITINQIDTRLDISGSKNELKDLARTFNEMLDRIQASYEKQNQFVSDASHELRTPISVIQGYVGILDRWGKDDKSVLEESIAAIKTESENMKDLIEKLLFLARGENNTQKLEKQDFYMDELLDELLKETRLIDTTHQILCGKNDRALINADRNLIKMALRTFVDNSIKYTPEGGTIKLECAVQSNTAALVVEDTGIGISSQDLPRVFDRFYRADKSRTKQTGGTGLGLSIAKWILLKHGGSVKIESTLNVGTKISFSLPLKEE